MLCGDPETVKLGEARIKMIWEAVEFAHEVSQTYPDAQAAAAKEALNGNALRTTLHLVSSAMNGLVSTHRENAAKKAALKLASST